MPQTIVITGASDGIGAAAARQLASKGERVVLVGRSKAKTEALARELDAPYHLADYGDLAEVRALAAELLAAYPHIDVLVNNAGGFFRPRRVTRDGFEMTFQVNYLAGFLLTNLLLPTLTASGAKVIQTSSGAAKISKVDVSDITLERCSEGRAYGVSKLMFILFSQELHRRYHDQGLSAVAVHPGVVASNFAAGVGGTLKLIYHTRLVRRFLDTVDEGGARLAWLAEGTPGVTWQSGGFYVKNKPAKSAAQADDPALAAELWKRSLALVGL